MAEREVLLWRSQTRPREKRTYFSSLATPGGLDDDRDGFRRTKSKQYEFNSRTKSETGRFVWL